MVYFVFFNIIYNFFSKKRIYRWVLFVWVFEGDLVLMMFWVLKFELVCLLIYLVFICFID